MWWRSLLVVSIALILVAGFILLRQERNYSTTPAASAARTDTLTMTDLYAGGAPAAGLSDPHVPEEFSAFDVSEGKRLYHNFNCVACHANGGGDIGPALMDDKWLYGAEPRNIYADIVEGRPNGMPSFRGKIPDAQVWQIVAYVRSMSGQVPSPMRSGRDDDMQATKSDPLIKHQPAVQSKNPAMP